MGFATKNETGKNADARILGRLWRVRDELSLRNIRISGWKAISLFPLAVIMGDLRLLDIPQTLWGLDSFTLQLMSYSVAILVYAFLPRERILYTGKLGVCLFFAILVFGIITPGSWALVLSMVSALAYGLCLGCAIFFFFFTLNNAERLLAMIVADAYYIICVEWLWRFLPARNMLINVLPFVMAAIFAIALFLMERKDIPSPAPAYNGSINRKGIAIVFYIYVVYMVVERLNTYIAYEADFISDNIMIIGGVAGLLICIVIQLVMNRSVWQTWNIFLICALLSMGLLVLDSEAAAGVGSFFYGVAYDLGYIAVFYLLGGVMRMSGNMRFFRVFCIVEFVLMFLISPMLGELFGMAGAVYSYISLGVVIAIILITMAIQPLLNRYVFETDWVSELGTLDRKKYADAATEVANAENTWPIGLTERERQVFTLLLTDMPRKQIAAELKISNPTANFHINNLYRKLDIQSRTELFSKYHIVKS
jgi:DNA-binding CsgD family transcriptional regulator